MREVPDLGFLDVWTNDSGSGFEHTKSLYVGRNGGAYMIREWKDDAAIAKTAGDARRSQFFGLLRDAARAVNPDFRVITRLESFYGEHETVWAGLGDGIDVETTSLIARGWEMPYRHPRYPDSQLASTAGRSTSSSSRTASATLARRPAQRAAPRRTTTSPPARTRCSRRSSACRIRG